MFTNTKALTILDGEVVKVENANGVLWEKQTMLEFTDLVPTALATDGTVLDNIGYRRATAWNGASFLTMSAFTAIGLIPIEGSTQHDIYVYGLNFTGTTYNRYVLFNSAYSSVDIALSLKDGYSGTYIASVTKLADNYFKITTNTYSSKVQYFALSGVTVSGLTPIVTMDEPIF